MAWRAMVTAAALLYGSAAPAIERIVVEADEVKVAGAILSGPEVMLDLTGAAPSVTLNVKRVSATTPTRLTLEDLRIRCAEVVIREPRFACVDGRLSARGGPTRSIDMATALAFDSARGELRFEGAGLAVAGGQLKFNGALTGGTWRASGTADRLRIPQIRKLLVPWVKLPPEYSADGTVGARLTASGASGSARVKVDAGTSDLNFSNEAGTVVAEKVALKARASAVHSGARLEIDTVVEASGGQALTGPVLLDFGTNPLRLAAQGHRVSRTLELEAISIDQKDLLAARGTATVSLDGPPFIRRAHADLGRIEFPAAYRSFLQIALAATDFGTLEATGSASGVVEVADDAVGRLDLLIADLDFVDERTQFLMTDVQGELHWSPGTGADIPESKLAWSRMRAYGLSGGTAELRFRTRGTGFELTREARLPVFDGAMVVHSLAARNLGGDSPELDFDADIEPISMPLLSRAFGWPELSGQLSGRIPGLTFRNKVLTLNGDVTARVFDGTIVGHNLRLQDPLGPWPRLFADVTARRLDLEEVTSTFSIGSITGRLDADLAHLELFAWSPVAFDAKLYSTPGDRSPHRISQKAVNSISSIGGDSGGVAQALQSGLLRFFRDFRYDGIGLACQLRNDVCLMSGIEPRGAGYSIVKGSGVPRIDIIGNQGRVDWPRLLTQVESGMRSEDVIVR